MPLIDLTGQPFGRLHVIERGPNSRDHRAQWWCLCVCDTRCLVLGKLLRNGHTTSCGCWQREITSRRSRSHGMRYSPEYKIWQHMRDRCMNPRNADFRDYGGRGIHVCSQWADSFTQFFSDMGSRPSPQHSLDRFPDCNGPYAPNNTRWATSHQQARNTRRNRLLTYNGRTLCVTEWAEALGLSRAALQTRLDEGWSIERALSTPPRRRHAHFSDTGQPLKWDKIPHIARHTYYDRLRRGWSPERALTTPVQSPGRQ